MQGPDTRRGEQHHLHGPGDTFTQKQGKDASPAGKWQGHRLLHGPGDTFTLHGTIQLMRRGRELHNPAVSAGPVKDNWGLVVTWEDWHQQGRGCLSG